MVLNMGWLPISCTAERRLAQPDNDDAFVLTVPLCLTRICPFVTYIMCVLLYVSTAVLVCDVCFVHLGCVSRLVGGCEDLTVSCA